MPNQEKATLKWEGILWCFHSILPDPSPPWYGVVWGMGPPTQGSLLQTGKSRTDRICSVPTCPKAAWGIGFCVSCLWGQMATQIIGRKRPQEAVGTACENHRRWQTCRYLLQEIQTEEHSGTAKAPRRSRCETLGKVRCGKVALSVGELERKHTHRLKEDDAQKRPEETLSLPPGLAVKIPPHTANLQHWKAAYVFRCSIFNNRP